MNELQQAITDLLNKFGIVIDNGVDWTGEVLLPYIQELIHRMQIYNIVSNSIALAISVLILILCSIFLKKAYSAHKLFRETDVGNWCFDGSGLWRGGAFAGTIICSVIIIFGLFIIGFCLDAIISWAIMPDANFIEYLHNMLA